jgi:RNA polymerase sigma-70 factor (ECF subfamily)
MSQQVENITLDDKVLVEKSKNGDSVAIERLIVRYQDRIFNVIYKICGNYDDAAELTQETFVKFIEKVKSFRGQSAFYTWLFRIAVNLTLNYCRRQVTISTRSLDEAVGPNREDARMSLRNFLVDESGCDPVSLVSSSEMIDLLRQAMLELSEDHRAVVILRDIEQMSYDQISEVLGLEVGTVKSRLSRARSNLREILSTVL